MRTPSFLARFYRRHTKRRLVATFSLALYLFLISCLHLPDRLILHPPLGHFDPHGATQILLPFPQGTTPNAQLELWSARSPAAQTHDPDFYVLMLVGNGDRVERWVTRIANSFSQPVEVLGLNFPGFGTSTGPAYLRPVPAAALALYDSLAPRAHGKPIFIESTSFGTTAALYLAAHRPIAGLTINNPPPLQRLIFAHHGWWNLWLASTPIALQIPSNLNSLINAPLVHCPALFILSDSDEVIPPYYHYLVVNAFAGPKRIITVKHAGHNTPWDEEIQSQFAQGFDWLLHTTAPSTTPAP